LFLVDSIRAIIFLCTVLSVQQQTTSSIPFTAGTTSKIKVLYITHYIHSLASNWSGIKSTWAPGKVAGIAESTRVNRYI
jgi:hypothetical protein